MRMTTRPRFGIRPQWLPVERLAGALVPVLLATSGCATGGTPSDYDEKAHAKALADIDTWGRSLPNGTREEWGFKRGGEGAYIKHGAYAKWHPSGHKAVEATYKNGKLHGPYRTWDIRGNLLGEMRFRNGEPAEE